MNESPVVMSSTTPLPFEASWTFLTNHSHVLACLAADNDIRLRDVADLVGITERAVQKIVSDLEDAGIIEKYREGRRNRYRINREAHLRHSVEKHKQVGDLLALIGY